jgi:hypothetical protein
VGGGCWRLDVLSQQVVGGAWATVVAALIQQRVVQRMLLNGPDLQRCMQWQALSCLTSTVSATYVGNAAWLVFSCDGSKRMPVHLNILLAL